MSPPTTPYPPYDLPMYDFPELVEAHEALWRTFVALVRERGYTHDIPLTQVCGYPLVTHLGSRFEAIGAPVYDVPFSSGANHRGLLVVGAETAFAALGDLRGRRFALNAWDSNTGMNLPRRLIAPLAERGRFFGDIFETGSHLASLAAVRFGVADVASVDNVTYALLAQHRPAAVHGLRILAKTAPSPTLPFVVPVSTDPRVRTLLYDALAATIEGLRTSGLGSVLRLAGIERASTVRYDVLLRFENEAIDLGYGTLA